MIAVDIREQLELCMLYEYMIIDLDGQVRGVSDLGTLLKTFTYLPPGTNSEWP